MKNFKVFRIFNLSCNNFLLQKTYKSIIQKQLLFRWIINQAHEIILIYYNSYYNIIIEFNEIKKLKIEF